MIFHKAAGETNEEAKEAKPDLLAYLALDVDQVRVP
jgi:hypothetical protein